MLRKIDISGVHAQADAKIQKYVTQKIGRLDRYIPRAARPSAHAQVKLYETKAKDKQEYGCEVIMQLPHDVITVHESTLNLYAAVDIVEEKLKVCLKKYKDLHGNPRVHQRLMSRFRRQAA